MNQELCDDITVFEIGPVIKERNKIYKSDRPKQTRVGKKQGNVHIWPQHCEVNAATQCNKNNATSKHSNSLFMAPKFSVSIKLETNVRSA